MNKIKLAIVAVTTRGLGVAGVSTAFAGQPTSTVPTKAPAATAPQADTDTVQQGDQTTPDLPGAADATETVISGTSAATKSAPKGTSGAASEAASSESGVSDGNDGGHQDAEGIDVNHQGDANEK